ncbi:hypothetical protein L3556_12500 [Candidatus Synechococcus calcipolaris G9]|uniref:FHA domain containing protein n=1 Tax=Candidatus Synechococcus calcipolaris G9 TaxID=1497997 RepID=A0ABT6F1L2_9SYNE|nr:hypothetical protein [Candidatus Synechococcus calcipolaris]MDG2991746.1 hypothetical protein [Candidatus Synechococcus calcipolaris G9]
MKIWNRLFQKVVSLALGIILLWGLVACSSQGSQDRSDRPAGNNLTGVQRATPLGANLQEVSPPIALDDLKAWLDRYQPQVNILSPRPNQTLGETALDVELSVDNLEIFQDKKTGLGPHLHLILDNQASQDIYDLREPIHFEHLAPGTHTLRAFALYPWDESFKNAGAFDQVTFNVLTPSDENNPIASLPLITYNQPQGAYGSESVLLDFYLTNAPLQTIIDPQSMEGNRAWQIRVTVNGQSFNLDRWQSIYLTGMKPGTNWVRLELLDGQGRPIDNAFNTVTQVVDYQPEGNDTRSRLFRGELTAKNVQSLLSRNFPAQLPPVKEAPAIPAEPTPAPIPTEPTPAKLAEPKVEQDIETNGALGAESSPPIPSMETEIAPAPLKPGAESSGKNTRGRNFLRFFQKDGSPTPPDSVEIEQTPEITAFPKPTPSPKALKPGDQSPEVPLGMERTSTHGPKASSSKTFGSEATPKSDESGTSHTPEPETDGPLLNTGIPSRYFKNQSGQNSSEQIPGSTPEPESPEPTREGL